MGKRNIVIGGAWPYANSSLHLGHIAGLISGDVLARYYRLKGDNVIYVSGSDCHGTPITERAKKGISFAFQQPVRFKGLTVIDMVRLAAGKDITIAQACEYLSEVGLCAKDYINRELNASLSGGEIKRIEIAMVLARGAKFSIFDEPEAGIDLWSFQNLIQVFEKMYKTINGQVLVISHQERILNIADKIIVLADGNVIDEGSRDKVMPKLMKNNIACPTLLDKMKQEEQ